MSKDCCYTTVYRDAHSTHNRRCECLWLWWGFEHLYQVHGVSGDLAKTIVSQFPTPAALIAAYKMCENVKAAQLMLSHVRASEQSPRGLGDVGSRRIYTLLFGGSTHLENE